MASAVSVAYGAAAGTSPPALVNNGFTSGNLPNDESGFVQLGSGTSPTTGVFCTITLGGNYSSGVDGSAQIRPYVWPIGAAQALGLYVSTFTGHTVTVSCAVAPTASQAGNTYIFGYRT